MDIRIRQACVDGAPAVSAVGADEGSATPSSGVDRARSHRIYGQRADADVGQRAAVDLPPGVTAVDALEHSPLGILPDPISIRAGIQRGGIHGVNRKSEDTEIGRQAGVDGAPSVTAVDALEHTPERV